VEMALWDLAGKACEVPVCQMLGGRFRDRIRLYADTTISRDRAEYARRLKARLDLGYTFLKMDLGIFIKLIDAHAVDLVHPDLASAGGILETKKIGDYAEERGVDMAMHFAGTPISFMANIHCAAATQNVIALEHHGIDVPWWEDLVTGLEKPLVKAGFVAVPDRPGLGIDLNEAVIRAHLVPEDRNGAFRSA
jgi:L-alanine-DL-glutamate epimerase-like enolase superfamily enzyme